MKKLNKYFVYFYTIIWLISLTLGAIISAKNKKDGSFNGRAHFTEFSKGDTLSSYMVERYLFYLYVPVEDEPGDIQRVNDWNFFEEPPPSWLLWVGRFCLGIFSLAILLVLRFFPPTLSLRWNLAYMMAIAFAITFTLWRIDFFIYYISNWGLSPYIN